MASDKRDFSDFSQFPGSINEMTNNYENPVLYKQTDTGKIRTWTIFVRLIKTASKKAGLKFDWNLMAEDQVAIKPEYLLSAANLPKGMLAQVWTESGQIGGKLSRQAPTYPKPTNIGKSNEHSTFQRALVLARAKYLKKLEEGSATEPTGIALNASPNKMYFPMLARKYVDYIGKIKYPVYIQPKLDGVRCVFFLNARPDNATSADVVAYSRQQKEYPGHLALKTALLPALKKFYDEKEDESVYLDGEIYEHGKLLQEISGTARRDDATEQQYHMYDIFRPSDSSLTFKARYEILRQIYENVSNTAIVKLVPTHLAKDVKEDDRLYTHYLENGYEGTIIRNPAGKYATNATRKSSQLRSKDLLKRKEVFEEEFEVVGFTQGENGRDVGAILWVCQTLNAAGRPETFNVTPTGSNYPERYALFKECATNNGFVDKYKNRMLTVEFRGLSIDNIPQHAKSTGFRDIL